MLGYFVTRQRRSSRRVIKCGAWMRRNHESQDAKYNFKKLPYSHTQHQEEYIHMAFRDSQRRRSISQFRWVRDVAYACPSHVWGLIQINYHAHSISGICKIKIQCCCAAAANRVPLKCMIRDHAKRETVARTEQNFARYCPRSCKNLLHL